MHAYTEQPTWLVHIPKILKDFFNESVVLLLTDTVAIYVSSFIDEKITILQKSPGPLLRIQNKIVLVLMHLTTVEQPTYTNILAEYFSSVFTQENTT